MTDWIEDLSHEETDRLLQNAANAIAQRGMEVPAVLFLEMHKPFSNITSQALVVTHPLVAPLVGLENVQTIAKLLRDRQNIEILITKIEDLASSKQTRAQSQREG